MRRYVTRRRRWWSSSGCSRVGIVLPPAVVIMKFMRMNMIMLVVAIRRRPIPIGACVISSGIDLCLRM
jgi:hypothetical protein